MCEPVWRDLRSDLSTVYYVALWLKGSFQLRIDLRIRIIERIWLVSGFSGLNTATVHHTWGLSDTDVVFTTRCIAPWYDGAAS